ncbi:MAG: ornithine cyclodeaminase family protein [Nevskiaceae bacterium]|jgi:ornithine cyclodeaminase/alanine dehydrogenase-like protein (mu-crystallin family)|nr:ornithine cyclodeaminase family protein [Nevskiaceae bacterium]
MLVLSNEDVEKLLTPEDCLASLEVAYRELADKRAANRERTHTYFPVEDERHPGFRFRFKSQEGGNVSSGVWALRITSDMVGVETLPSGVKRRRLLPAAPGGRYVGLVTLYSMTTLEPLCMMHDSVIQKWRVGATSALGIRGLANPDAKVASLFGSGWQAESHLHTLLHVRPSIEEVRIYSPTQANRERFVREQSPKVNGKVRLIAVDEPRKAVQGCQIVTCATATMDPCFSGEWLEPGTHVTSITSPDGTAMRRELDDATFDRADRIVVLSKEQILHDNQIDILGPVQRGRITMDDIVSIPELLAGVKPGRTGKDQITVYANNTGMGLQFAAVGARIHELALEKKIGREVPTDWFLEDTTP